MGNTNRKVGTGFEKDLCVSLAGYDFWAHNRIGAIIAEYMYEASEWEGIMYRFGRAFGEEAEENYKWISE